MDVQEARRLRESLDAQIWEHERKERDAKIEKMVNKFFVYRRNCYSCPREESDYWDVWARIFRDASRNVCCISTELTSANELVVKTQHLGHVMDGRWEEVQPRDYLDAVRRLREIVSTWWDTDDPIMERPLSDPNGPS